MKIQGLWFPPAALEADRLLSCWEEGCRLLCAFEGALLVYPTPRLWQAEKSSALPIVSLGLGWCSFPGADPLAGEVVLKWRGAIWRGTLARLELFALDSLWDVDGLNYLECRAPEAKPLVPKVARKAAGNPNARSIFVAVPQAAPEQKEYMRRVQRQASDERSPNPVLGFFDLLGSFFDSKANQRYLSKMVSLFEQGDWKQALRYAIPLGQDQPTQERLRRFVGELKPREGLDYTSSGAGGSYSLTSDQGIGLLHQIYHNAMLALERAERWEEAAFVRAELLGDHLGAVDLLEKHGLYETAAKLATLKGLPAALQVRLWFRAGNKSFALSLARCHLVHAEAMRRLEQIDPAGAREFRKLWVEDLVSMGEIGEAVVLGWPIRESLPEYRTWFEQALAATNSGTAKAVVLALKDESYTRDFKIADLLEDWYADESPLTLGRRRRLLELLVTMQAKSSDPDVCAWAGRTARRMMRHSNTPWTLGESKQYEYLLEMANDQWLRADAPKKLPGNQFRLDRWHQRIEERGHLKIFDAVALRDGRTLVALGYAGLTVLSRSGAVSQQFDIPCHRIVKPLNGDNYLTESHGRIGYFAQGRAVELASLDLHGCADHHDGLGWYVWRGNQLLRLGLDSLLRPSADSEIAVAQVELSSPPLQVSTGPGLVSVHTGNQVLYYGFPSFDLKGGFDIDPDMPYLLTPSNDVLLDTRGTTTSCRGQHLFVKGEIVGTDYQCPYGVIFSRQADELTLCIFETQKPRKQLVVELPGAEFAKVRTTTHGVVVSDSCGRLLIADTSTQTWLATHFL